MPGLIENPEDPNVLDPLFETDLEPLFWAPTRTGVESAWASHVPFAHWLVTVQRPSMIVELGTHNGVSYAAFCEAVQRMHIDCCCLAFDTWQGDEHAGAYGESVYADLKRFHDNRYSSFSKLTRCTFDAGVDYVPDGSIDLLHIDGLHTYEAVKHDFETWLPKVSQRAVVLFHDINERERGFGVWDLWRTLRDRYPSFEFFHGHGLGVLAVGSLQSPKIQALVTLPHSRISILRERFAALGERWDGEIEKNQLKIHANNLDILRHAEAERAAGLSMEASRAPELERALHGKIHEIGQLAAENAELGNTLTTAIAGQTDAKAALKQLMEASQFEEVRLRAMLEAHEALIKTLEQTLHQKVQESEQFLVQQSKQASELASAQVARDSAEESRANAERALLETVRALDEEHQRTKALEHKLLQLEQTLHQKVEESEQHLIQLSKQTSELTSAQAGWDLAEEARANAERILSQTVKTLDEERQRTNTLEKDLADSKKYGQEIRVRSGQLQARLGDILTTLRRSEDFLSENRLKSSN